MRFDVVLALLVPDILHGTASQYTRTARARTTRVCRARRARKNEPDTATFGFEY